jgi:hypothetical protein
MGGTIAVGQASSCTNPVLDLRPMANGLPVDLAAAAFAIWSTGVGAEQVYPALPATSSPLNVTEDCPDGDRLGHGHLVAPWTVPDDTASGTYEIRWFLQLEEDSPELTFAETFNVVGGVDAWTGPAYTTLAALRDEGVTVAQADDARLRQLITLASELVESITRQWFDARPTTLRLDGDGTGLLVLPVPIVSVSRVLVAGTSLELDRVAVYNRFVPDDRRNPKLVRRSGCWPCGEQNIEVEGVFGYVDPAPGAPGVVTPAAIRRATELLVIRELEQLASSDRDGIRHGYRLLEERTRDQGYKVAPWDASAGAFAGGTGDPEIDALLRRYMKPLGVVRV